MKRFFNVLAIALACAFAVGMTACEGGSSGGGGLTVNPGTLEFPWAGGSDYVAVTGSDWTVSASAGISAVKEGNSVLITVSAVTSNRTGTVTVSNSSDTKTINVRQQLTADDMVGTWTSNGYWYNTSSGYSPDTFEFTMTKASNNTVTATNVLGFGEGERITITINSDGTISIPSQPMNMSESTYGWPIYFNRVPRSIFTDTVPPGSFADNWGEGWENIPFTNNTIDLSAGGFVWDSFGDAIGTTARISVIGFAQDVNGDHGTPGAIYFFGWMTVNTVWTKGASAPAPEMVKSVELNRNITLDASVFMK